MGRDDLVNVLSVIEMVILNSVIQINLLNSTNEQWNKDAQTV